MSCNPRTLEGMATLTAMTLVALGLILVSVFLMGSTDAAFSDAARNPGNEVRAAETF